MPLTTTDGNEISSGQNRGGIWQQGNGTYPNTSMTSARVWTGSFSPTALGTVTSTCNNWSDSTGTGQQGYLERSRSNFWSFTNLACSLTGFQAGRLYCYEP